jgi:hypothetical protein
MAARRIPLGCLRLRVTLFFRRIRIVQRDHAAIAVSLESKGYAVHAKLGGNAAQLVGEPPGRIRPAGRRSSLLERQRGRGQKEGQAFQTTDREAI